MRLVAGNYARYSTHSDASHQRTTLCSLNVRSSGAGLSPPKIASWRLPAQQRVSAFLLSGIDPQSDMQVVSPGPETGSLLRCSDDTLRLYKQLTLLFEIVASRILRAAKPGAERPRVIAFRPVNSVAGGGLEVL